MRGNLIGNPLRIDAIGSVITLYDQGNTQKPFIGNAHEIERDILDIAQGQVEASGRSADETQSNYNLR